MIITMSSSQNSYLWNDDHDYNGSDDVQKTRFIIQLLEYVIPTAPAPPKSPCVMVLARVRVLAHVMVLARVRVLVYVMMLACVRVLA